MDDMGNRPFDRQDDGEADESVYESMDTALGDEHEVRRPSPREEIEELIASGEGRLSEVFVMTRDGLAPDQIAQQLNVATASFVYSYRIYAEAALNGTVPGGPTLRAQTLSAVNALVKRGQGFLSPEAMNLLLSNRAALEVAQADHPKDASIASQEREDALLTLKELSGVSGIYAFSYGWYLESPVDDVSGNTLIKVGRADDVAARIRNYTSGVRTHMPEPLALIRVYSVPTAELGSTEAMFHELLENAGHTNPRRRGDRRSEVGREWFLTNEDYLDSVAKALRLKTLYLGRSEFAGD